MFKCVETKSRLHVQFLLLNFMISIWTRVHNFPIIFTFLRLLKLYNYWPLNEFLISVILTNCEFVPILIHQNLCINRIKAIPSIYFYQFIIQHLNHVIIRMFKTIRKKLILFLFNHIGIFVVGYAVLYG